MLTRCLAALVAGLALALSFPSTHVYVLLPLAVGAFFVVTDGLPARWVWLPGLLFGAAFQFTLLWWMHVLGVVPWLGLSAVEAAWYGLLALVLLPLRRLPWSPCWLALAWVAMENIRTDWPAGGMPWGRLSYAVIDTPVAAALPYLGATGVSLLLALAGALVASLWKSRGRDCTPSWLALGGLVAATAVPVVLPYGAAPTGHVRVAAVQGNVPGDGTDVLAHYRQITEQHVEETSRLAADVASGRTPKPDFVVWPENSTALDPFRDPEMRADLEEAVTTIDVPLLAGVVVDGGPEHVLNQGIVFDPVTGAGDRYTKWHPVPFGEYIPWRGIFGTHLAQLNVIPRDMMRGTRVTPLSVGGVEVADAICFDVAYDDGLYAQLSHGGQLVVVQTSNAMFIHTDQIDQQFAISRLRAIETHRYVVVAAINGLTGVIAPDGSVTTSVEPRTTAYAEGEVLLYDAVTPAVRIGPWLGRACVALTAAGLLVALVTGLAQYRRGRRAEPVLDLLSAPTDRTLV